ncbi:MAG: type II toxin-antitoxin system RelE/ParE family toxin [Gammaproteobacteria bacterium]|nr:type II toxin-antitoxin system RelE/ParE family toxin [Gammaproteobacteria bacterium]
MTTYGLSRNRNSRPIGWIKAARKVFETFPDAVRDRANTALTIAAEGGKADIAKPLKGVESGVFQIAIRHRTNAWRVVYVAELAGRLWVIHAFRKKSKVGTRTPKPEIDLIVGRLARLKREKLS